MNRKLLSGLIFTIIGLAMIGLFSQLFTNTLGFFKSIFISIGIGLTLVAAIYFIFLRNRKLTGNTRKYKQAVKQSKSKYNHKHNNTSSENKLTLKKHSSKKNVPYLRVIDGNKSKGKNRSTF